VIDGGDEVCRAVRNPNESNRSCAFERMLPNDCSSLRKGIEQAALADAADTLMVGSPVDGPFVLTGASTHEDAVNNTTGSSTGSLTAITQLHFAGSGHIQSTFAIGTSIPEPGTLGLLGLGVGALLLVKLRGAKRVSAYRKG